MTRNEDFNHLKRTFQSSLDESKIRSWLRPLLLSPEKLKDQTYAMGSIFRCLRMRTPLSKMDLAIKLFLAFDHNEEKLRAEKQLNLIRQLETIKEPTLVPPFQLLTTEGIPVLVMPFGDQDKSSAAAHWQPLAPLLDQTHQILASHGLRFRDIDQIRCWRGIPMMIDLSDLQRI